jgi:tRNA modification GTPase
LIEFCALLEVELDFSEEEVEFASREQLLSSLNTIEHEMDRLVKTFHRGRIAREGISLAIVGRPNVGKSTVLNRLLKRERAIVTTSPGTTRDTVEEPLELKGILFRLIDTAGLRDTEDEIEREGVERAENALIMSDMALLVLDASEPLTTADAGIIKTIKAMNKPFIVALNKNDLTQKINTEMLASIVAVNQTCKISALKRTGISRLESLLANAALGEESFHTGEVILTRMRHLHCAESALDALHKAHESLNQGLSPEFIVMDIRGAMTALEELTGKITNDDIINHIFSQFCIGK